jgi:hypothetical protein
MSAKLTPEICINNASRNSRLTAVGRQATASDSHSQNCLRLFFFLSLYLCWENNETTRACSKTHWNSIAFELRTLCGFFFFCVALFYFMLPLWWDNYRTTSEAPSPGLEAEGWTPKLLRLKLHCIWTWRFFFKFLFIFLILILFHYI